MPRPTTRRSPAPSQFPNSSVNQFNRRKLLAGAGAALGAGAVLGGLGSAGVSALSRHQRPAACCSRRGEPVTFGSNYSDPVDSEAIAAARRGHRRADDDQHRRPQHLPGELQHLHPAARRRDVVVRRLPHAGVRQPRRRRRHLRRVGGPRPASARASRPPRRRLDGKQYFVPFYYYPWAVHYRKSVFEDGGYTIPTTWDEFNALARPDADRRDHPARRGQRRQLAADGHVRHAQHADQRLRLPRLADGRPGELDRRPGQAGVHHLGGAAPLLPARRQRPHVAGRGDRTGQRRDRDDAARHVHRSATSTRTRSRTSSTTSTSSPSRRSTTSTARTRSRRRSTGS